MAERFTRDLQYYKFCLYGFLKNLRFFEPFLLLFFLEKGLNYFEIGVLYAIKEISTNVLEIPTGVASDAVGRRRTMIFSFVSYIISFAVFYFAMGLWAFIGAMVLFSFGEAFRTGTHKAMIFQYLKMNDWTDQKVHYYGHTRSWSQIGSAVSAAIAMGLVFFRGRYASIFLFTMIPYSLDLLLMLTYPKELDGTRKAVSRGEILRVFGSVVKDFVYSFRNLTLLKSILNLALYSGYYKAAKDYLQPLLKSLAVSLPILLTTADKQRTAVIVGVTYTLLYAVTSIAARSSGRFTERFSSLERPLNVTLFVGLGLGIASGVLYHFGLTIGAVVLYIGIYLIENLRKPVGIAYVSDQMRSDILATALSAESQVETIVTALVALVLGLLADKIGVAPALAVVSLFVVLAGIPAMVRAKPAAAGKAP